MVGNACNRELLVGYYASSFYIRDVYRNWYGGAYYHFRIIMTKFVYLFSVIIAEKDLNVAFYVHT